MDAITLADLSTLVSGQAAPCLSLYMATHGAGHASEQDPLRFGKLIDQAEQRLAMQSLPCTEIRELVAPLRALAVDAGFWQRRSLGLAVFRSHQLFQRYRLPLSFASSVAIKPRFVIRPLLPLTVQDDQFLLLTLSHHRVRLYAGDRYEVTPGDLPPLPTATTVADVALAAEPGPQAGPQAGARRLWAAVDAPWQDATLCQSPVNRRNSRAEQLRSYFRTLDWALQPQLRRQSIPLLIAGSGSLLAIYRDVNTYTALADQQLEANCDYLPDPVLHKLVWPRMQELMAQQRQRQIDRIYRSAASSGCVADITTLLREAAAGRVNSLLLDQDDQLYGTFDPATGEVTVQSGGEPAGDDLLDLAAFSTLRHQGETYAVPREAMPGQTGVAAMLRC